MTTRILRSLGALLGVLALVSGAAPTHASPASYADAKALAAKEKKPLLVDFYATWCGPCKRFTAASESDAEVQKSLGQVVLFKTDAEKGEGIELAKTFDVKGYPTFVLLNGTGETIERWSGYHKPQFVSTLDAAVADPTTIEAKTARFEKSPSANDAEKLARYYGTRGKHAESLDYSRKAANLDPTPKRRLNVVETVASGMHDKAFTADELEKERDLLLATKTQDPEILATLTQLLSYGGREAGKPEVLVPAIEPTLAAMASSTDPAIQKQRDALLIEKALLVDHDKAKAYDLKLASMPEGWKSDPGALNGMAWWCFENQTNLKEAEALAREGVALAPAGPDRAMINDTLAEILYVQGKKQEAEKAIQAAIQDDPGREYYKKQLERFHGHAHPDGQTH